jgi:RND family efflux transporter MFP subunit
MTTFLKPLFQRTLLRQLTRWLLTLLVVGGFAAAGYWGWQRYAVPQVTVTEVVTGPVVQAFYATGTLLPYREYPIKSNVEGTLVEVLVDKGVAVKKGQLIARVYVEEFLLKRAQAEAELELKKKLVDPETSPTLEEFDAKIAASEKQLEFARREFDRLSQVRVPGGRTATDLDNAEEAVKTTIDSLAGLKSAKATRILELQRDLKTAQAQLDIAQWNIDQQAITSPIDGVVLDWPVSTGTRVKVNDMLLTVADVRYDQLVMRTNVDEEDKIRVRLDQTVQMTLYSYPDRVFEGRVKRVYPKADPSRRTFEVDVQVLEPDAGFSAGMTGELAFVVDRKESAVVIPSQAVQAGNVWIVRDQKLSHAEVTVGLRSIQRTEILSGLQPGDEVVVSPIANLRLDQEVRVSRIDPQTAAGINAPQAMDPNAFKGLK